MLGTSSSCATASRQVGHFRRRWLGSHALMVQRSQQTACPQGRKRTAHGRSMHTAQLPLSSSAERGIVPVCAVASAFFCVERVYDNQGGYKQERVKAAGAARRQISSPRKDDTQYFKTTHFAYAASTVCERV